MLPFPTFAFCLSVLWLCSCLWSRTSKRGCCQGCPSRRCEPSLVRKALILQFIPLLCGVSNCSGTWAWGRGLVGSYCWPRSSRLCGGTHPIFHDCLHPPPFSAPVLCCPLCKAPVAKPHPFILLPYQRFVWDRQLERYLLKAVLFFPPILIPKGELKCAQELWL